MQYSNERRSRDRITAAGVSLQIIDEAQTPSREYGESSLLESGAVLNESCAATSLIASQFTTTRGT